VQKQEDEKGIDFKSLEDDWKGLDAALPAPGA